MRVISCDDIKIGDRVFGFGQEVPVELFEARDLRILEKLGRVRVISGAAPASRIEPTETVSVMDASEIAPSVQSEKPKTIETVKATKWSRGKKL